MILMISFKCCNCCKTVFDHLNLSLNAANAVLTGRICVKYQYPCGALCAYARFSEATRVCLLERVR